MRLIFILLALAACKADETISGYTDSDATWALVEMDGKPFPARATIAFPSEGNVTGQAPGHTYTSTQTVPLPWFELGPIIATKMACADLNLETRFFEALTAMTLAEVAGNTIILTNDMGREMVFKTTP